MVFGLSLMVGAGAMMGLMLFHKHLEVTRGVTWPFADVRHRVDPVLREIRHKSHHLLSSLTWRNVAVHIQGLFVVIGQLFMYISYKTHKASARLAEKAARRKEDLSKGGSASFYMKQMKDVKENGEKGEIVER